MFRLLAQIWQWIKGWFRQNPPTVSSPSPTPQPELSDLEYENLLLELLEQVALGRSWGQLQGYLIGKKLEPDQLARWLSGFGQRWLLQPESHGELAQRLWLLSRIATGELRSVARSLAEGLSRVNIADGKEEENTTVNVNHALLNNTQPNVNSTTNNNSTVESDNELAELFQKGEAYLDQSKYEEEVASYRQTLKLNPGDYQTWSNLGAALNNLGRNKEAIACCEQVFKLKPDYSHAWYVQGYALEYLKRYEEAVASFDQALQLKPDYSHAWYVQGVALDDLERYEEAVASFDQALKLQPDFYQAWNSRGVALLYLGGYEEAVASFDQALKLQPDFYQAWSSRGLALLYLERYEETVASSDQALKLQPDDYQAWSNRGLALRHLERYEEAVASFDQALKLQPDDYQAWSNCGNALDDLERYEEAVASFDQALKLQPDCYQAWSNRGLALLYLERYEEAVASFDQALKLQPDFYQAWNSRGVALLYLERYEEAVASFDQALKRQPDLYQAWSNRGLALDDLERYEEAVASFDQALKRQPDLYQAWLNRGTAAYKSRESNYSYYQQQFVSLFYLSVDQAPQKIISSLEEEISSQTLAYFQASLDNSLSLLLKTFSNCDSPQLIELIKQPLSPELYQLIEQPIPQKLIDLIQQPLSAAVIKQLEQDVLLHPYHFNPQLNLRGYQGKIASLQAELDKAIKKETHPLGWGILHYQLGKAHYDEGSLKDNPVAYWHQAVTSYRRALSTLTAADYAEEHLEVLQDLIKGLLGIGETEQAELIRLEGLKILKQLLNDTPSFAAKKKLTLKFVGFLQLRVDILVNQGELIQALTSAELSKNLCLNNLLSSWQEEVICPSYEEIQGLLTPTRAIVYWHLSPQALQIFVLKANATEPIIIEPGGISNADSTNNQQDVKQIPKSQHRLQQYKTWLKDWNRDYQDYRGKNKEKSAESRRNYTWRNEIIPGLEELKRILDIDTIQSHLSDITQLILVPHQDLHRLPLQLLFEPSLEVKEQSNLTISYVPSLQLALTLQQRQPPTEQLSLLSVENPANDLAYAEIESTLINQMFSNPSHIAANTATNSAVKIALQQPHHLFHFTGHGAYNQRQPQNSALTLAGDEQITAQEISQLNLNSYQLITLAACETAITGNQTIDTEYVGLVSGFLQAGATSVLSTLWTVEEISSAWLMIRFYQLYLEHNQPDLALKPAQQWLRNITYPQLVTWIESLGKGVQDSHPQIYAYLQDVVKDIQRKSDKMDKNHQPYEHPYYWAAFTLTGGVTS